MPPLRERAEDIPLLVRFLVDRFAARIGKPIEGVSQETMRRLAAYRWPGNIRELENVIERAVILAAGPILDFEIDRERPSASAAIEDAPLPRWKTVERRHILAILEQTNWVIEGPRGAAGILGLHPNTLRSRLKKLGISAIRPRTLVAAHDISWRRAAAAGMTTSDVATISSRQLADVSGLTTKLLADRRLGTGRAFSSADCRPPSI